MDTKTFCEELLNYYTGPVAIVPVIIATVGCAVISSLAAYHGFRAYDKYKRGDMDGDMTVMLTLLLGHIFAFFAFGALSGVDNLSRVGGAPASLMSKKELRVRFPPAETRSTIKLDANVTTP